MRTHLPHLAIILIAVSILYAGMSRVYYCGYDDFADIHRAAFEDTREPTRIFTTTHFETPKYRPLQRGLTYITWHWGRGSATAFRIRNLTFHVLCAAFIYGITWLLTCSRGTALAASLLFALHPLANQSIVAAIWTNTTAYACLLGSFFFFLYSTTTERRWVSALLASFALVAVGLFTYEGCIVVFAFMYLYLGLCLLRGRRFPRSYLVALIAGTGAVLLLFFGVRHAFVMQRMELVALPVVLRNTAMYLGALVLPIDPVLAHTAFGTPLPSDLKLTPGFFAASFAAGILLLGSVILIGRRFALFARLRYLDWPMACFLLLAIVLALGPFLAFTPHPSETYLYLPVALEAILLSLFLQVLVNSTRTYVVILSVLLVSFSLATSIRNQKVAACGTTAEMILAGLPISSWRSGEWHIRMATPSGEPTTHRYGIYGYTGLGTIDPQEPGMPAAEWAVQVATRNERAHATVVSAAEMDGSCSFARPCFWVSHDGRVTAGGLAPLEASAPSSTR
jgi:hypothetical protein